MTFRSRLKCLQLTFVKDKDTNNLLPIGQSNPKKSSIIEKIRDDTLEQSCPEVQMIQISLESSQSITISDGIYFSECMITSEIHQLIVQQKIQLYDMIKIQSFNGSMDDGSFVINSIIRPKSTQLKDPKLMGNPVILPRADSCDVPPQKKPRIQFDTSGQDKMLNISVLRRFVY